MRSLSNSYSRAGVFVHWPLWRAAGLFCRVRLEAWPWGLPDGTRKKIASTRKETAALQTSRTKAAVGRDVVESFMRAQSSQPQICLSDEAVSAAEEMSKLAAERQASQGGAFWSLSWPGKTSRGPG